MIARTVVAATVAATLQLAQAWQDMSPGQRYDALRNYQQHENLPEDRKRAIEQRYQRWQQMPESERERIRQNFQRYQALPESEQQDFRKRYERWKQTPQR
jgi:hypothetical protein